MTSSLLDINNAAVDQRGLKQDRSEKLFALIEWYPTKVGTARLYGKFRKIVRCIDGTAVPRDKGKDLVTIYRPKMNRTYAEIRYQYVLSGLEDHPHLLGNIDTAGIYAWDRGNE